MSSGETGKDRNLANSSLSSLSGLYDKPFLSTDGGQVAMPGENISLRCSSAHMSFDRFSLSRPGGATLSRHRDARLQGDFTLGPVNLSFSGVYTCYGWHSGRPYVWSAPSNALELVVTGKGIPPTPARDFRPPPQGSSWLSRALASSRRTERHRERRSGQERLMAQRTTKREGLLTHVTCDFHSVSRSSPVSFKTHGLLRKQRPAFRIIFRSVIEPADTRHNL